MPAAIFTAVSLSCGWRRYFHSTENRKAPNLPGGLGLGLDGPPVCWWSPRACQPTHQSRAAFTGLRRARTNHLTLVHLSPPPPPAVTCSLLLVVRNRGRNRTSTLDRSPVHGGHTLPSITLTARASSGSPGRRRTFLRT